MAKNDEKIKTLMGVVTAKTKALGTKPKINHVTNALFGYGADQRRINLNTINDEGTFVDMLAFLLDKEAHYIQACKALDVDVTFGWGGFTVAQWTEDFKSHVDTIQWKKRSNELAQLETKLKELRSEEAQTEDALDDIAALLG
jgi:hypothetical protein